VKTIMLVEAKMLTKHRNENVNNTTARSGGIGPSTNGRGLLLIFNLYYGIIPKVVNKLPRCSNIKTKEFARIST
jgi:hypothetical protein